MRIAEKSFLSSAFVLLALAYCGDTARAQNLAANPSQVTFNTQAGVTPTPQTLLVSSSGGQLNVTVATTNNPWLVVSPNSGLTPFSITVSVNTAGAPASGTDVGFINLSAPGAFLSVQVTLNVNSPGGTSPLSTNPNSLSFAFAANSTVPASQNVSVTSNNASVTTFTATATTNGTGNWLSVSPDSGNLPATLQVSVNPTALTGAGPFNAAVAINAPGTSGVSLPVLVTVGGTPSLKVDPSQFSFAFQIGATVPAAQTLSITSSTGAIVSFTATPKTSNCGNTWLVLSQQSGATAASISVQVNTSGLTAGNCNGEIDISAPGASNPNVVIPVTLLVSANPLLQVPSTGPTFTYQIGASTQLAAQNVQITSSTPGVSFTATATPVSGGPNFLVVTPSGGTTPQALALTVNASVLASLGPGAYSETVTVTAAGAGNSPQSFPVTLIVSSNATLNANVSSLTFNYQIGQTPPPSQLVTVTSTGAPVSFQVAANTANCSGFLSATPSSGVTFGPQNQVVVSVNVTGLTTAQTCNGNVTLTVPGSSNQLVIPVSLNVSTSALLNVSQQAINVTALTGGPATVQMVAVTSTDPNTQLGFTAVAATNPIGLTWLAVTPNSGNTPSILQITINPANLLPGTYNGSITVSGNNVPSQVISVTLTVFASSISATPASLTFTQSLNGPAPGSQAVQISGVPAAATVGVLTTMFSGSAWLTASVAGSVVTVSANGALLSQGTYLGVVTVIVPGAANSPLYVPVTLIVNAAQTLAVSPNSVNFAYQIATTVSAVAQPVQVTSSGASVPFTATFIPGTGGNFVTVTSNSGNTPATVSIALNASVVTTLLVGNYSGQVVVSSPNIPGGNQTINVSLIVTAAPPPQPVTIKNSAGFTFGAIAPGEIVIIEGTFLGPANPPGGTYFTVNAQGRVDSTLAGVQVLFDTIPGTPIFVSPTVINVVVPYEIQGRALVNVTVVYQSVRSASIQQSVAAVAPGIFTLNANGQGQAAVRNENYSINGPPGGVTTPQGQFILTTPALPGSIVSVYGTGGGQTNPPSTTGSVSSGTTFMPLINWTPTSGTVTATIGGQPATVTFAGAVPTEIAGAIQINLRVPTGISGNGLPIVISINGFPSQPVGPGSGPTMAVAAAP